MLDKLRIYKNILINLPRQERVREYFNRPEKSRVSQVDPERLDRILESYQNENTVFLHAGLKSIKKAFAVNPYLFLLTKMSKYFSSILVPGFTPSFRRSGLYHKQFSRPEVGKFSELFLQDAHYRTDDPLHSIQVKGEFRFPHCNHQDTFGLNGCYSRLDQENILYCNIGIRELVCVQIHFIENTLEAPYVTKKELKGIIYYNETEYAEISQLNYAQTRLTLWNRRKIEKDMLDLNIMDKYNLNGLILKFFRAGDLRKMLEEKIRKDPWYLVK